MLLGSWHVRNGVLTDYWGFSTQADRAAYFLGGGIVEAQTAPSYTEARHALQQEIDRAPTRPAADVAADMRRRGLGRLVTSPVAFVSTYAAGIVTTMLHPGSGAFMRLVVPGNPDGTSSVTQMLTLGRWRAAYDRARDKTPIYWPVTVVLFGATVMYAAAFLAGAWWGRRSPPVILVSLVVAVILAGSGGPDGDSRRRAPLVPLMCVVAAPVLARRWPRVPA